MHIYLSISLYRCRYLGRHLDFSYIYENGGPFQMPPQCFPCVLRPHEECAGGRGKEGESNVKRYTHRLPLPFLTVIERESCRNTQHLPLHRSLFLVLKMSTNNKKQEKQKHNASDDLGDEMEDLHSLYSFFLLLLPVARNANLFSPRFFFFFPFLSFQFTIPTRDHIPLPLSLSPIAWGIVAT